RGAGRVGIAGLVDGDGEALTTGATAEISGVDEPGPGRIHLRHEGVGTAGTSRLEGPGGRGEVRRAGKACYVCVAGDIHGDAIAEVDAAAAEISGVDEPGPGRIHLRHEGVSNAAVGAGLKRPQGR